MIDLELSLVNAEHALKSAEERHREEVCLFVLLFVCLFVSQHKIKRNLMPPGGSAGGESEAAGAGASRHEGRGRRGQAPTCWQVAGPLFQPFFCWPTFQARSNCVIFRRVQKSLRIG